MKLKSGLRPERTHDMAESSPGAGGEAAKGSAAVRLVPAGRFVGVVHQVSRPRGPSEVIHLTRIRAPEVLRHIEELRAPAAGAVLAGFHQDPRGQNGLGRFCGSRDHREVQKEVEQEDRDEDQGELPAHAAHAIGDACLLALTWSSHES